MDEERLPSLAAAADASDDTLVGTVSPNRSRLERPFVRGDVIGRYVVLGLIGRGGMGVVYKAFDPQLDRSVAIKLLLGASSPIGSSGRKRLVREAQSIARIAHPNVIAVHDVGTIDDRIFFTMEYVEGQDLRAWLAAEPRSASEILDVFAQAGEGVAAAHDAGLVHRDFKPANVLVDGRGRARVLDFGLARGGRDDGLEDRGLPEEALDSALVASPNAVDLTGADTFVGTPAYMAPEQFAGETADARTDQFAFCVALFEALTGERPFRGDTFAALSAAVLGGVRVDRPRPESTPMYVWRALERGLALEPGQRFGSMPELLEALGKTPRSQAPVWIVGATACAIVGAAIYAQRPQTPLDPCAEATVGIAGVWSDGGAAIGEAFERTGKDYAADMAERTITRLDAYAQRWTEDARAACLMTRVEASRSDALLTMANDCFAVALASFDHLRTKLENADEQVVLSSVSLAIGLPALRECTERSELEVRVPLPADEQAATRIRDARADIRAAKEALENGGAQACLDQLSSIESQTADLAHLPTQALILDIRAQCQHAVGLVDEAPRTEDAAFTRALAGADDLTAIRVATTVGFRLATSTEDLDLAAAWIQRAEALQTRHRLDTANHVAPVLNARAILYSRRGDLEGAIAIFGQLYELTADQPDLAQARLTALGNMGVAQAAGRNYEAAAVAFSKVVEESIEIWGLDHPETARAQAQLGKVYVRQYKFREALEFLQPGVATQRKFAPPVDLRFATDLHALAVVQRRLGDDAAALRSYEEAYAHRKAGGALATNDGASLMAGLGNSYADNGRYEEAEPFLRRALEQRQSLGADPRDLGEIEIGLATLQQARGDLVQAKRTALLAAENILRGTPAGRVDPAEALFSVGALLERLGAVDDARRLYAAGWTKAQSQGGYPGVLNHLLSYAKRLEADGEPQQAREVAAKLLEEAAEVPGLNPPVAEAKALLAKLDAARQAPGTRAVSRPVDRADPAAPSATSRDR